MRYISVVVTLIFASLFFPFVLCAQSQEPTASVPRLVNITGVFRPADGQPPATVETVTLAIYADAAGGAPLWQETQTVTLDDRGRYSLLLGATTTGGIPSDLFAAGEAHWLGTRFERAGEVEGPRVRLTSVPYALRAADADTLGGRPASDYVVAPSTGASRATGAQDSSAAAPVGELPGTANIVAKYVDANNVGPSAIFENNGMVGVGTTTPFDFAHVKFTNTNGAFTGLAVQNMGNTATSYSGMLFFDQNNALGQFQGFNNVTHEYRINNIASTGSINFMLGSTSKFVVAPTGNIGIGTTSPSALLEVNNGLTTSPNAAIANVSFGANANGSVFVGRKARGTATTPASVQAGDNLALFNGRGYGTTTFGPGGATILMRATENYSDATQGAMIQFQTAQNGTNIQVPRLTINHDGDVGIGTTVPNGALEVSRTGDDSVVVATSYKNGADTAPVFLGRSARGTLAAPTATQHGDLVGALVGMGYGTTDFSNDIQGGIAVFAAENFTDTAHGASLAFATTPLGTVNFNIGMALLPSGFLGIGTPADVDGVPSATDRLQVFGDIRVGDSGTNGCIKNFAGSGIIGTCSSDRRLKKNITPFGPALDKVTALQPVHYFWRSEEFPDRHFGNAKNYGLIAQYVEQVLPELVATDSDGYKAVDYSKLPLLTIQAVKELKAENDALKQEVAELKRLMNQLLAKDRH